MLKFIISNVTTYNKLLAINRINTYYMPLIIRKININYSQKQLNGLRSVSHSTLIVGRLHLKNSPKFDSLLEPKTQLEARFCDQLRQHFSLTPQECLHICMICRSALDSHLNSIESIDRTTEFVGKHFTAEDVYFNPQIFLIHWRTLNNRTHILKELGFNELKIVQIDSCFKELLDETPNKLKIMNLYDSNINPLQYLLNSIDCPDFLKKEIQNEFDSVKDIDSISFTAIRRLSIAKYLSCKLGLNLENAFKIVEKRDSRINSTCFSNIISNISLLMTKFQMPTERLKGSSFLLTVDYNNLLKIFNNINTIAGKPLTELCVKYPQLLDTKYSTIVNNIKLLKKFNITDDQILRSFQVLTLNSDKLEKRFQLFYESEELKEFDEHPRKLRIIVHLKTVFDRLERLKATGCLSISLDQLVGSKKYFEQVMLQFDGFKNNKNAIENYLLKFFKIEYQPIKIKIGSHPYGSRLNVSNANKIIEFFIGLNLTKEQIINGIFIVLYEYELVKHQYKLMTNLAELQPFELKWKNDPFLLQLLIYYIEKNYSFTGNGVYVVSNKKQLDSAFTYHLN